MQNPWVTIGLVALVVVLLAVLWMRRPRHRHRHEPPTIEELVAAQVEGDERLVEVLRQQGVDLNSPRHIDLEFYTPSEDAARRLVASLEGLLPGEADVRPSVQEPEWAVTYVVSATVSSIVQPQAVEQRIRLAAAVGGEFDGWGTPADKR
ncbi:MAG: hypothetical protein DMD80_08525 [Candidatus Rokuibacteriota bacterium]|nr:MAG: hypothetical protein DMD80_08525 [Candidatus Rokubacteria bacterium]